MRVVELKNGKTLEIKSLTWKQAKQVKFLSTIGKYAQENAVIDEEDLDKIIDLVVPNDLKDELTIEDAIAIFTAVMEETFEKK